MEGISEGCDTAATGCVALFSAAAAAAAFHRSNLQRKMQLTATDTNE
jgi:hypothetical protein